MSVTNKGKNWEMASQGLQVRVLPASFTSSSDRSVIQRTPRAFCLILKTFLKPYKPLKYLYN